MTGFSSVYITVSHETDEATRIAKNLVASNLAACVNILSPMTSIYRWEGALCEDREVAVLVKTRAELVDQVIERVRELHSYSCPCIVAWPIVAGNPDYLEWLGSETGASNTPK
ncbi:MAG: divalent-cation tolerance protein CutA [Sphingomonadales bacterium]